MKVKKLIKMLKKMDPESVVIMQKDSEGNGFSPLRGVDGDCVYVQESTWSGEVYNTGDSADENCLDQEDWDKLLKGPRAVILFPTN